MQNLVPYTQNLDNVYEKTWIIQNCKNLATHSKTAGSWTVYGQLLNMIPIGSLSKFHGVAIAD